MLFKLPVYLLLLATAYTNSVDECGKSDGITASGVLAQPYRTVAVDHLPFGTKLKYNDIVYVVEDRFGGNYSHKIDIYMESKEEAFKFGKRVLMLELLDDYPKRFTVSNDRLGRYKIWQNQNLFQSVMELW